MGCSGSKKVNYEYKDKKRSIPIKDAKTLDRWTMGAHARFMVIKKKRECLQTVTNLPKPCLIDGEIGQDPD